MTNEAAPLGPARLWRDLTIDQRLALSAALWADQESVPQQMDAVQLIARQLRFRPQSVLAEPVEKRTRQLASLHTVSESVADRALVVYHLTSQRPMLEAFLTRLGINHENGMITDTHVTPPDPAALRDAATALATEFPAGAVRLYLRTLAGQDPETWSALAAIATEIPSS
ncbi:MAG: hypothetical protein NTV05_04630 [Acidobacteria bacterium]|nr:hypothetical protein [Acidobacteriota bacterium]